jgi:hypothetical protein
MIIVLITAVIIFGPIALYFAIRSREVRKFLAGAFFVSFGFQFYFWLTNVTIPVVLPMVGTFIQTPQISGVRSILHFILFILTFYFGFIRKPAPKELANAEMRPRPNALKTGHWR